MSNTEYEQEPAYEIEKRKKRKGPIVLGVCLAGAAAAIAIPIVLNLSKTVKLSDFTAVSYDGIDGYAKPVSVIDTEGLYNTLAGDETDAVKLENYKNFADSVSASVSGDKVSNGDSLEVNVTFDEELRKKTGYKVSGAVFNVTAEGIEPGKAVSLFEDASINITGISPDALLSVENKSEDEYLKGLEFSADKENVANGDSVVIRCNVTDEELAQHGYTTTALSAVYEVKGLSEYLDESHITDAILQKITDEGKTFIESETADDTYRMIYKLTNNAEYLTVPNTETAEGTELVEMHLLKRKPEAQREGNPENLIIAIYKTVIKVQDRSETGYFAFLYPDSYVTADGKVEINSDTLADTMQMNTDENSLKANVLQSREASYELIRIDTASQSEEAETESATTVTEEIGG